MSETLQSGSEGIPAVISSTKPDIGFPSLRVWPAVALLAIVWLAKAVPMLADDFSMWMFMLIVWTPLLCTVGIVVWWLFASGARIKERLLGLAGFVAIGILSMLMAHETVSSFILLIYMLPWVITAFAGVLICLHRWASPWRVGAALLATCVAFGYWDTVRFDGLWGDYRVVMPWRWEPTAEKQFLAELASRAPTAAPGAQESARDALGPVR